MIVAQIETRANNRRTTRELDGELSALEAYRSAYSAYGERVEIETQLLVMLTGLAPHHLLFSDFAPRT